MAAIMAVREFPPRFSLNSHVNTESRYGIKSAFRFFLLAYITERIINFFVNKEIYVSNKLQNGDYRYKFTLAPASELYNTQIIIIKHTIYVTIKPTHSKLYSKYTSV